MGYDFKTITHITKSTFEADHPAELLEFKEKLQAVLGEGISFKTFTMHSPLCVSCWGHCPYGRN
jgi:hypothetical protein